MQCVLDITCCLLCPDHIIIMSDYVVYDYSHIQSYFLRCATNIYGAYVCVLSMRWVTCQDPEAAMAYRKFKKDWIWVAGLRVIAARLVGHDLESQSWENVLTQKKTKSWFGCVWVSSIGGEMYASRLVPSSFPGWSRALQCCENWNCPKQPRVPHLLSKDWLSNLSKKTQEKQGPPRPLIHRMHRQILERNTHWQLKFQVASGMRRSISSDSKASWRISCRSASRSCWSCDSRPEETWRISTDSPSIKSW